MVEQLDFMKKDLDKQTNGEQQKQKEKELEMKRANRVIPAERELIMVMQWYNSRNASRFREILNTQINNTKNPHLDTIVYYTENCTLPPELAESEKVINLASPKRFTVGDLMSTALTWLAQNRPGKFPRVLLSNIDILFDDTLKRVDEVPDEWFRTNSMALGRYSYNKQGQVDDFYCRVRIGSADTFIFIPAFFPNDQWFARVIPNLDFPQGVWGYENRLMYEITQLTHWTWFDTCNDIKTWHYHNIWNVEGEHGNGERVNVGGKSISSRLSAGFPS
jgi:hypothetical protein